jgi:hypothetical protein
MKAQGSALGPPGDRISPVRATHVFHPSRHAVTSKEQRILRSPHDRSIRQKYKICLALSGLFALDCHTTQGDALGFHVPALQADEPLV